MNYKKILVPVIVAVVFAGGGFYGGMLYQKSQSPARGGFAAGQFTRGGAAGAAGAGRATGSGFTTGTVLSKDATSITVQLAGNAGTKIVFYTPTTPVMKSTTATPDQIAVGDRISVTGSANSDGSVTAQSIMQGNFGFGTTTRATPAQ